jgi:hypothetical protein
MVHDEKNNALIRAFLEAKLLLIFIVYSNMIPLSKAKQPVLLYILYGILVSF